MEQEMAVTRKMGKLYGRMADESYGEFALAIHRQALPWQSTGKRSLETVMFRNVTGLFEMAVCCAKPPYATGVFTPAAKFIQCCWQDLNVRDRIHILSSARLGDAHHESPWIHQLKI
jgi:hypothetical protein